MIRNARLSDQVRIEEIVQAAYAPWAELIGARPLPMDADYRTLIEAGHVFVTGPGPDGLIVLIPEDGVLLVENVAVAPDRHGHGIGRTLLSFAEDHARALAVPRLRLYTNELMTGNIALYASLGYHQTGREDIGGRHIVHMVKDLAAARLPRASEIRAEAEAVAADPDDRAEVAAILKDMENLRKS